MATDKSSAPKRHADSGVKRQTIDRKRQKKTINKRNDAKMETNSHPQTNGLGSSGGQTSVVSEQRRCAFCHSSKQTEGSGPFVAYAQGKEVTGNVDNFSNVIHVHLTCVSWTPKIYFKNGFIKNLESEIIRANDLKCSSCGKKGAGLGCYTVSCKKTYHVPCAYDIPGCRWDSMHLKSFQVKRRQNLGRKTLRKGLSSDEKFDLVDFASSSGAVVSIFRDNVTHVIAATDSKGAGARTYKLLMAILHGKWILTMGWVKACMEARKLVNEEPYEVLLDNHGSYGGPKEGRLRVQNNAPKLFNNLNFYFIGDFLSTYKADLLNLVTTAGGTVIETRDRLLLSSHEEDTKANVNEVTLVVYNADFSYNPGFEDETALKCRVLDEAEDLAQEVGCQVVPHIWILDSIACGLQPSIPRH
ncbi:BRCA1-associated RING domain protein 1 isoform X2 [Helianthus annuus]|uniref:BRCA1-associated RING domain protein 1 isoform X2 n=1 Tax=Helianthus annuus TaxID=4232 RepID=UPI0016530D98|nr:BRCA1-associated RING domain protein 1 isoform X2 [Helianthus annuus]